jgi:hypothetical protein
MDRGSLEKGAYIGVILALALIITTLLVGTPQLNTAPAPSNHLEVTVAPNAIPVSGTWIVTTVLVLANGTTEIAVNSTVTMTATLSNGTQFVQILPAQGGQATFTAPTGTVGVRFEAEYQDYRAWVSVSGPTVVPWAEGEAVVAAAVAVGVVLPQAPWLWPGAKRLVAKRVLAVVPGIIVTAPPLAYMALEYPTWFGTQWVPLSLDGFPIWGFDVCAVSVGLVVSALVKYLPPRAAPIGETGAQEEPPPESPIRRPRREPSEQHRRRRTRPRNPGPGAGEGP